VAGYDDYYPFGLQLPGRSSNTANTHADQITCPDASGFTGHFLESEGNLGLYHAQARLYDPEVPRFYGVDAMRGDMPGWNPYHYTFNNPVRFVDPDGNMPCCVTNQSLFYALKYGGSDGFEAQSCVTYPPAIYNMSGGVIPKCS
jgi:RHS repeat-associated protein